MSQPGPEASAETDRFSSIERAVAKSARSGRSPPPRPEPRPVRPQPHPTRSESHPTRPKSQPARLESQPVRPEPALPRLEFDPAALARRGLFAPNSSVNRTTEEFRLIKRTVLERAGRAQADGASNANLVMVTSTREGEGKTFVALNLAFSLAAEQDRSVLLIDADPAKSSVSRYLGFEVERGLTDLLRDGGQHLMEVAMPTSIEGLTIIASGDRDPLGTELFASDRMGALLQGFCRTSPGSVVILDAPPVLATSEPSSLARHVDQTLLVVEADRTSRAAITEALNLIAICPRIGLVLNKARFRFGAVRFGAYYKTYYRPGKRYAGARH